MKKIIFILAIISLVSCKDKNENTELEIPAIESQIDSLVVIHEIKNTKFNQTIESLIHDQTEISIYLESAKNINFNNNYEVYREGRERKIIELNKLEDNLLENYITYYDNKLEKYVLPDSVKIKSKLCEKANLEFWGVGEGFTELRTQPNFYYNVFKNYVTKDYSDFLLLEAKDNSVLYSADAGISITFEEVSERVLYWENYLNKYPKSKLFEKAREDFINYCTNYLFGMDNTPTFEYSNNEIYPENQLEFDRFISKNPKSKLAALVNLLMTNIKKMNADELRKMLNDKCSKLYNPK